MANMDADVKVERKELNIENRKKFDAIKDKELKKAIAKAILIFKHKNSDKPKEEISREINERFEIFMNIHQTFERLIELEYRKIEILRRIERGIVYKLYKSNKSAEEIRQILAKIEKKN